MELLETAYPEVVFDARDSRSLLRAVLDKRPATEETRGSAQAGGNSEDDSHLARVLADTPLLSFRCPLSAKHGHLRIRLPRNYPERPLFLALEGTPHLSPGTRGAITTAAEEEARIWATRREPHCLQVLGEATRVSAEHKDFPESTCDAGNEHSSAKGGKRLEDRGLEVSKVSGQESCADAVPGGSGVPASILGRRLIYSHHIIAPQKRTGIVRSARDLGLGGYSKVGWPGVIVVEGQESQCEEFVKILRRWRWKHLAVRGEEVVELAGDADLDEHRRLPRFFEELEEGQGVSAIAERCRAAGLGDLFATLLR